MWEVRVALTPVAGLGLLDGANTSQSYFVTYSSHNLLQFTMPAFEGAVAASLLFFYSGAVQVPTGLAPSFVLHAAPPVISAVYSASLTDDPCLMLREYPALQGFLSGDGTAVVQSRLLAALGGGNGTNGTTLAGASGNRTNANATAAVNAATATILYTSTQPQPSGDRSVFSSSTLAALYSGLWDNDGWETNTYPYNASLVSPGGGVTPFLFSPAPCFPALTTTGTTPQVGVCMGGYDEMGIIVVDSA